MLTANLKLKNPNHKTWASPYQEFNTHFILKCHQYCLSFVCGTLSTLQKEIGLPALLSPLIFPLSWVLSYILGLLSVPYLCRDELKSGGLIEEQTIVRKRLTSSSNYKCTLPRLDILNGSTDHCKQLGIQGDSSPTSLCKLWYSGKMQHFLWCSGYTHEQYKHRSYKLKMQNMFNSFSS